jgi:hypothetical protein
MGCDRLHIDPAEFEPVPGLGRHDPPRGDPAIGQLASNRRRHHPSGRGIRLNKGLHNIEIKMVPVLVRDEDGVDEGGIFGSEWRREPARPV